MGARVHYSGLVIAGIGFLLTRFTVTLAIYEEPVRFYLAGILPLSLGLGLAAFGVALAVADVEADLVRTTAAWCVVGAGTMLVLVLLTLLGSSTGGMPDLETVRSQAYLSNFLIGGSVGGTLTGLYASRNRHQREELRQQANRLEVLNRLLRHEVLNALTVIRGYAPLAADESDAAEVIAERADAIEETIEEVRYLARSARSGPVRSTAVDLGDALAASVERVHVRHPEADVAVGPVPADLRVLASDRLELALAHLVENAVEHGGADASPVEVAVETGPAAVRVAVTDEGPGLPPRQQALLETGDIPRFDDPGSGFGLNLVRLLVEGHRGTIETRVTDGGTTVTLELPRADVDAAGQRPLPTDVASLRTAIPNLLVTLVAAVAAGVFYGLASELLGGSVAGIGVFYGTASPVVGWITHEFHSVVFGFVYAGLVSLAPHAYRGRLGAHLAIGVGWALVLWVGAAGLVAPLWLRLLGIPVPIPNVTLQLLVSHLAWGVSLGVLTGVGYTHAAPALSRLLERRRAAPEGA